jgi:hypothetical protein
MKKTVTIASHGGNPVDVLQSGICLEIADPHAAPTIPELSQQDDSRSETSGLSGAFPSLLLKSS